MMTTAPRRRRPATGPRVLVAAALVAVAAGAVLAVLGALVDGSAGARGGLVGTVATAGVLLLGTIAVDAVAGAMPSMSLLFALLTYALQLVVLLAVVAGLARSGLLGDVLSRPWLAAGVVVATLTWLGAQVAQHRRARIPAYDLGSTDGPRRPEAGAR